MSDDNKTKNKSENTKINNNYKKEPNKLNYDQEQLKKKRSIVDLQKEIAKAISKEGKDEDELQKSLPNADYDTLVSALKNMLSLKLITKEGYPVKYSLSEGLAQKLFERKQMSENDKNDIRVSILIESKADDKGKLRRAMEDILGKLRIDKTYFLYDSNIADIIVHDDLFSTYISAEVSCATINDLLRLVYFYGVTSIDVIKPTKYNLTMSDLQQSLFTIVDMTHGYAQMIFDLRTKLANLEKTLNRKK
jgi:hypothetical protein